MFTTRTPVSAPGFCGTGFGSTVTRTPVSGSYIRPTFGSGIGSSWCRPVTRTPVCGSGYYGNSYFGSSSPYSYSNYYSTPYYSTPSYYSNHCYRPVTNCGSATVAGLVAGAIVFASLI